MYSVLEKGSFHTSIQSSWKRCRAQGLLPNHAADDDIKIGPKLRELQEAYSVLLQFSIPILEKLIPHLKRNQQIAHLVDPNGNILHHVGDPNFFTRVQGIQLQRGANWNEAMKGTNAIGLALIEKIPVIVEGDQHFFRENHFISCASSPIFSSNGDLLGVLNISGPKQLNFYPAIMLACLTAERIQTQILIEESKRERLLMLQELECTTNLITAPVIALDPDQRIIRANQAARTVLGPECVGRILEDTDRFKLHQIKEDDRTKTYRAVGVLQPKSKTTGLRYQFKDIFGTCPLIIKSKEFAQKAALTDFPVLILGESGTGKELFAQSIHQASSRQNQPFVAVNCSAIPDNLIESELFGYERGAFTGGKREGSIGKFEAAHQGTIFLDEIGDMSLRSQAALLRVIQEQAVMPIGSTKTKLIDVRILAATHRNLLEEVKAGRFRADLYYRLKGIQIRLPALRERSDIGELAEHLFLQIADTSRVLTKEAKEMLKAYQWPGNIRELSSVLMNACFFSNSKEIDAIHLDLGEYNFRTPQEPSSLEETERGAIVNALKISGWNLSKTAKMLNIGRSTLYRKINFYQIKP